MANRILEWHIPTPGAATPTKYVQVDSMPIALRIHAGVAPAGGDLILDILDDGVSIMNDNNYQKTTFKNIDGYVNINSQSGTFTVRETITGGTSGATGIVKQIETGRLVLENISGTFSADETVTGGTSAATGNVVNFVAQIKNYTNTAVAGRAHAILPERATANTEAQDFRDNVQISEGSWLSLSILEYANASNITVQLELMELGESETTRHIR